MASESRGRAVLDCGSAIHSDGVLEESRKVQGSSAISVQWNRAFSPKEEASGVYRQCLFGGWVQHPIGQIIDHDVSEISERRIRLDL